MANIVKTTVNIGSELLTYYSSISVHQQIFEHDTFSLVLPSEYIEGKDATLFEKAKDLIGKDFTVQSGLLSGDTNSLQFTGIITHIRRTRSNGYNGDIVITGCAPTILLDSGPHCKSWKQKTLKTIFEDVLRHFPENRLNAKVSPTFSGTLDYVVQYRETAWEFLKRMCATYGEWLYYDGASLIIGRPIKGQTEGLIFGSDLRRFDLGMGLKPVNKKVMSYDYSNTAVYSGNPKSAQEKAGLDELGNHAWKTSQALFATTPKSWDNDNMVSPSQLNEAIDIRSAMNGSSLVVFEGEGSYPALSICGSIHVSGSNLYSFSDEDYGVYTPISVTHNLGINNSYTNSFQAIPGSVQLPPIDSVHTPRCETQSAKVVANNDPQGMGRIQVRFHWMGNSETTPWIRVTTPHAGGGKGMYFIPEVDEEVIVGFEGDSAIKPYVIGAVYNSRGNNSFGNAKNDVKALQSRSGNKLVLNDNDGSVYLSDQGKANMFFDGAGNTVMNAKVDHTHNVEKNNTVNTGEVHLINVGEGQSTVKMDKDGNLTIKGLTNIKLVVEGSMVDITKDKISISASNIEISGNDIQIKGKGHWAGGKVIIN